MWHSVADGSGGRETGLTECQAAYANARTLMCELGRSEAGLSRAGTNAGTWKSLSVRSGARSQSAVDAAKTRLLSERRKQ